MEKIGNIGNSNGLTPCGSKAEARYISFKKQVTDR